MPVSVICWKIEKRLNALYRDVLDEGSSKHHPYGMLSNQEKLHAPLKRLS